MNIPDSIKAKPGAETATRARNAFRIAVIGTAAMIVSTLFYVYLAFQYGGWQLFAFAAAATVLTVALLASIVLIRRGWVELGMWLLVGAVQVTFVIGSSLLAGLGVALASATLLTVVIATQTLPTKQANWAIGSGVIAGVAALLVDVFELPFRLPAPAPMLAFVPIICGAVVLVYGYLLYRQFGSYTLRAKLITAFLIVTLIPLGLLAYLNDRSTRIALAANIGSGIKALASTQALMIGNELDRQITELYALSQHTDLRNAAAVLNAAYTGTPASIQAEIDRLDLQWRAADAANDDNDPLVYPRLNNALAERLRDFRAILPDNVEVFVTDKYGALVAATNRTSDYNQADEGWWQATYDNGQGATFIGPLEYDESSKTYASNIAVPLYAADDKTVVGVLRTTLQLGKLFENLNVARLGQTGHAELFIPGRQKLAGQADKPIQVDATTAAQIQAGAKSDYIEMAYDGIPSLVSQAPVSTGNAERAAILGQLGWVVVVHQDQSEGLAPLQAQTRGTLVLVLVIAAAVTGAAIGAAQLLSGPITRLIAVTQKVSAGDLAAQARVEAQDEIGTLANAFNLMVSQLRQTLSGLEQRVAQRTAELSRASDNLGRRVNQLQASSEVSRAAATLTDPERLIPRVVELIQQRFDFYYVGLFLVDADSRYAVLQYGSGAASAREAGRVMKERGHRLELGGQSMVGFACANKRARIALDVGAEAMRFANPLLPDTRSEMALPLLVGDRALGALDIQSMQEAAFDQGDIAALQGMADQVAIALENARLFQQTQAAIQQTEQANRLLVRQGWQGFLERPSTTRRSEFGLAPVGDEAELVQVPLELRGQRLGHLKLRRAANRPWTDEEKAIVETVALQTMLAAENARLVEQTQTTLQETEGLFAAARDIAQAAQIQDICQSLASYVNVLEESDRTLVTLVDAGQRQILARVGAGNLEGELDITFDEFDAGLSGKALRSGEPILSLSADDAGESEETRQQRKQHDIGALCIVPLSIKGQVIGAVSVVNRTHQRKFTQRNIDLAAALAGPAATALENVRLLEATQRRAERERLIRQITTRIRSASDTQGILETTAVELAHSLGVPRAIVRLTMEGK
jgi:GAF domain-containing protein/methyl-accepting chemotaxis protein